MGVKNEKNQKNQGFQYGEAVNPCRNAGIRSSTHRLQS